MNKMYFLGCMGILAASAMLSSCSSDNDDPTPSPNPGSEVVYKWTTNGGLKACDHILFGTDDKENANGTQIGNGDQEFVFTGKQTLKKGTYLLKGWVYIADGAELTIEPGTIIKGDKETKAALIVEPEEVGVVGPGARDVRYAVCKGFAAVHARVPFEEGNLAEEGLNRFGVGKEAGQ